jgi:hypothetical protein
LSKGCFADAFFSGHQPLIAAPAYRVRVGRLARKHKNWYTGYKKTMKNRRFLLIEVQG